MTRTNEAFWWSLFSAGGALSAMVLPALVVVTGFALPYWIVDSPEAAYGHLEGMLSSWLVRLPLMAVIGLSFFHCGHRIRHTLTDMGVRVAPALQWLICYGGAIAGTAATVVILGW
ncbi:MAG: fumarate reductase subunit FrdD [Planctomycetota bacterium]|jgi:fumarate reductase subunit D